MGLVAHCQATLDMSLKDQDDQSNESMDEKSPAPSFLSFDQISLLSELDVDGVQKQLEEFLNFKQCETSLMESILLDYYVSGFWWAKEMNFTLQQMSDFMALIRLMLDNLEHEQMSLEDNIQELWDSLVGEEQSYSEISSGLAVFNVDQTKAIIDYLKTSLFQHYKLYQFIFYCPRSEVVLGVEEMIEIVNPTNMHFPAPLEEGIPCDMYSQRIAKIPGTEEIEEEIQDIKQNDSPVSASHVGDISQDIKPKHLIPEIQETENLKQKMVLATEKKSPEEMQLGSSSGANSLSGFTIEDVKSVLGPLTKQVIDNVQVDINEKLHIREEAYSVRIDKLKRNKPS
ncbi:ciliary-associated calcium-binding coiled-coil protein 1 isoform X2 [Microcaecilia unicolor]|uniref:Ciliary-associated calcium-binding coiled-coil protein 1 isoform X2 n=1 Tax=Microcaecilia unicolor TaxID=1415580 RepID=A0A6P7Y6U5_9AMPH|nr:ciliary-associated calcium-binding coiled-coil protein 1 isoform X2 [Microcaecilia unicolor]